MATHPHRLDRADSSEIAGINAELAALLHMPACSLNAGADTSLCDDLVVCGILGGKDVGKSTLINALARQPISKTDEEVGAGTTRPVAFIHEDAVDSYRSRFGAHKGDTNEIELREHDAAAIRNVVLIDMPDFDSDMPTHFATVKAILPLLDRIIWVVTPRKIADRVWVELFHKSLKHNDNIRCVLNKADELLSDDTYAGGIPHDFIESQRQWALNTIEQAGCGHDADHLFICAAECPTSEFFERRIAERWGDPDWSRYSADRAAVRRIGERLAAEIDSLRECVLSPVSGARAQEIKQANRRVELDRNRQTIAEHYALHDWIGRLDRACDADDHRDRLNTVFGSDYVENVAKRLAKGMRTETELADGLLAERVDLWPILPIIFWPLRGLVRRLGARFAGVRWTAADLTSEAFTVLGQSLADRVANYHDRLCGEAAVEIERLDLHASLPKPASIADRVQRRTALLVSEIDDETLSGLKQAYRRPSFLRRWAMWLVLLWFPFLQPIIAGSLNILGAGGSFDLLTGLAQIVTALSAAKLLTGFLFSLLVYVIILATMYARCVSAVRKARRIAGPAGDDGELIAERLDDLLVTEVVGCLAAPFADVHANLVALRERLRRLS